MRSSEIAMITSRGVVVLNQTKVVIFGLDGVGRLHNWYTDGDANGAVAQAVNRIAQMTRTDGVA